MPMHVGLLGIVFCLSGLLCKLPEKKSLEKKKITTQELSDLWSPDVTILMYVRRKKTDGLTSMPS